MKKIIKFILFAWLIRLFVHHELLMIILETQVINWILFLFYI